MAKYSPEYHEELVKLVNDPKIDLAEVDVCRITNFSDLFAGHDLSQDRYKGIEKWDVSNATNMSYMFSRCDLVDFDLSGWKTSKVENFTGMFILSAVRLDLSKFDVSSGKDFGLMFSGTKFMCDPKISGWDVSSGKNFVQMFENSNFMSDLSAWKIPENADTYEFAYNSTLTDDLLPSAYVKRVQNEELSEIKTQGKSR